LKVFSAEKTCEDKVSGLFALWPFPVCDQRKVEVFGWNFYFSTHAHFVKHGLKKAHPAFKSK